MSEHLEPGNGDTADGDSWKRLHPGTILDDAVQRIPSVLIGVFLILTSGGRDAAFELLQLAVGVAAISPVVVRYLTGRYRLGQDVLQWRAGLITKVHTDLPRHRIQTVDTRIGVIGRVLGLESVVVSSAGGEGEIRIGLIDSPTADALRTELSPDIARDADPEQAEQPDTSSPEVELASLGSGDLVRVIAVDAGRVAGLFAALGLTAAVAVGFATGTIGPGSILVGVPLVVGSIGIFRGLVTEAVGFSSHLRDDRIRVARGIVARTTFEAPLARVQGVTVKRTFVARRIGTERISVDTADVSGEGSSASGQSQTLMHPIAPHGTWRSWASTFLRGATPGHDRFRRVARVSLRRRWFAVARHAVVLWLILVVAVALVGGWLDDWAGPIRTAAIALGIVLPAWEGVTETLRYRNERWALGDDQVAFRRGAITTTLTAMPRVRTQGTMISANWFQRRLGIADITVDTASPTVAGTGRDLHLGDASSVAAALLTSADAEGGV